MNAKSFERRNHGVFSLEVDTLTRIAEGGVKAAEKFTG